MQTAAKTSADHIDPIRSHCEMLHGLADGIDGVLVVSVYYAAGGNGPVTHHSIGDVDGMYAAIVAHQDTPGANVYTGLQVMRRDLPRGKRGTKGDIVAVLGLVADMDADTGKVGELPVHPNYIMETSPGNQQPAWLFDRPLHVDEAAPLAAALKRATGSDHGTADVDHVWRISGTKNWPNAAKLKRGRSPEPVPVRMLQAWGGDLIPVDAFRAALAPWKSSPAGEAKPVQLGELPDVGDINASADAAAMLAANDVDDRSKHASKVVEKLAFDGHSAETAAALFLSATGDWLARYSTEERARADFERLWAKFGTAHAEMRDVGTALAASLTAKAPGKPANDNSIGGVRLLSFEEYKAQQFGTAEALIKGLVRTGTLIAVGGRPGAGKTALMIAIADALDRGEPFLGRETKETTVAYIAAEDGGDVANRLEAIGNTSIKIVKSADGFPLTKPQRAAEIAREVVRQAKALDPDRQVLLVVDTLRAALGGQSVLDDKYTSPALNALREVAESEGVVVAVLNHTNRENNKATKGETLEAVTALELVLLDGEGDWHTIYVGKNRSGPGQRNIGKVRFTSVQIGDVTAAIIEEMVADETSVDEPKERGPSANATMLKGIISTAILDSRDHIQPFGSEGPRVKAAQISDIRVKFYARKEGSDGTKKTAFRRALNYWIDKKWIVRGSFGAEGAVWLAGNEVSRALTPSGGQDTTPS
jgi:KaiC/GvpD/RAD55 family RecA-like ATPase